MRTRRKLELPNLTHPKPSAYDRDGLPDPLFREHGLPVIYALLDTNGRRRVRLLYCKLQQGLCAYCKEDLTSYPSQEVLSAPINVKLFPDGFFSHPIHLHHNHTTGMTIGAVHATCNAYLFQYKAQ